MSATRIQYGCDRFAEKNAIQFIQCLVRAAPRSGPIGAVEEIRLEDGSAIIRIHRRAIVAVDRIKTIERLTNGDALVALTSGCQTRASRRYRKELWERWQAVVR